MKVDIDLRKSLQENADYYFQDSKKAAGKLRRLEKALGLMEGKLKAAGKKKAAGAGKAEKRRKREWYEKFRWFISSDGFLVIGGRDAGTNEIIVKRHTDSDDGYFHADIMGAPHVVVKAGGKKIPEATKKEAAVFAASFSNAWREGFSYADVYSVRPEQVSKEAPSGEFLGKGAFVIRGKREWFRKTGLNIALGIEEKEGSVRVISGPPAAVSKRTALFFRILQGEKEKSEVAKLLRAAFEKKAGVKISLDEIIAALPNGKSDISGK
jgi:predicted ribosome quality control (RQC) complex YloA/Tae2 family protein